MQRHDTNSVLPAELATRYVDLRLLGSGGMGEVHRAWDRRLEREVALKAVRTEHRSTTDFESRLKREARALARIVHPNVIRVFDVHVTPGCCLYAMEYVEGSPLSEELRADPRPDRLRALSIIRDLADALAEAHREDVIHRDIKSENVLMTKNGVPKLVDFGLARFDATEMTALTRTGEFVGTLHAIPPEVFAGRTPDAAGDVYQLGLLLHEMLTGRHVHGDSDPQDLLSGRGSEKVARRLATLEEECPEAPAALIRGCLAERPEDRPSAEELRNELTGLIGGGKEEGKGEGETGRRSAGFRPLASGISSSPAFAPTRRTRLLVAGSILFAVAALVMTVLATKRGDDGPPPVPRLRIEARRAEAVWTTARNRRFEWRLLAENRVVHRGGESAPSCIHSVRLSSLAPGRSYRLDIIEGDRSWPFPFRTPEPRFEGGIWTFADKGVFFLSCAPPPAERIDVILDDGRSRRTRRLEAGQGTLVVGDLEPKGEAISWSVELAGTTMTEGRTPVEFSWERVPGQELDPQTGKPKEADLQDGPIWMGDRLFASSDGGLVSAFALDRRRGDAGRGHGLRLLWTCQPNKQVLLLPLMSNSRMPNWLTLLPDGLLFCATLCNNGRIQLQTFHDETRARTWSERMRQTTETRIDGLPSWAQVDYGDWNRPICDMETERTLELFGSPNPSSLLHEDALYGSFRHMRSPTNQADGHGFVRVDPRRGDAKLLGTWPGASDRSWPAESFITAPPVLSHDKLFSLVHLGKRKVEAGFKLFDMVLIELPLKGPQSGRFRVLHRFDGASEHVRIGVSEGSGLLYVGAVRALVEIDPRDSTLRELAYAGPDDATWNYVAAMGPVRLEGRDHFVVFGPARRSVSTSVMGLQEFFGYLAFLEDGRLVARGPRLCAEVDDVRLPETVHMGPWAEGLFALTRQNAITYEVRTRRFRSSARLHSRHAALDGGELVALDGPRGRLAVLPVRGLDALIEGQLPPSAMGRTER